MITLVSPAKKQLDTYPSRKAGQAIFFKSAHSILVKQLKQYTQSELAKLLSISDKLAELNHARYANFDLTHLDRPHGTQALYLFQGDVYQNLDATSLSEAALTHAEQHFAILSGLYGLLQPFDWVQPHRLEMGIKLAVGQHKNLVDFWRPQLATRLNSLLKNHDAQYIINLASNEYSQAIDLNTLEHPMITIHFKELRDGQYKTIGILAKRARGMMARYILTKQIDTPDALKTFNEQGYQFDSHRSDNTNYTFVREE